MASIETAYYHSDDIKRFKLSCVCCFNHDSILKKIKLNQIRFYLSNGFCKYKILMLYRK